MISYKSIVSLLLGLSLLGCDNENDQAAVSPDQTTIENTSFTSSEQAIFKVAVSWTQPLTAGSLNNKATLSFRDAQDQPLPVVLSGFKLFMPAMGHGTIKADQLVMTPNADDSSRWTVDQIYFSMGGAKGEWVVDVTAQPIDGRGSDKVRVAIDQEVGE